MKTMTEAEFRKLLDEACLDPAREKEIRDALRGDRKVEEIREEVFRLLGLEDTAVIWDEHLPEFKVTDFRLVNIITKKENNAQ